MRAAETVGWVVLVVMFTFALVAVAAVLANGRAPKRPTPPEMGDDIHSDGEPFTDEDLARYITKWRKDHRRG